MKQTKHKPSTIYPSCMVCGKSINFNKRRTNCYCSDACKQAAYRQRHGLVAGDKVEHYRKVIETKRNQVVMVTCQHCDRTFEVDQTRAAMMYCSDACKQAAYRERRVEKLAYEKQLAKTATFASWLDLPDVLREMERLYFGKHGYNWSLCNAGMRIDGQSCYLDTQDGTRVWFQDKERARQFLVWYVATGQPNYAMLRQR